ncbi:hypothetical protein FB45DRAFT_147421 [Roridomyces roridus]|uniref:Protein argonaute Mid domain-containing protein n=1 Tax=Roridomyces roridus TaxID=1738132 RepID=A0AAD7BFW7_9AGAR|nr:hypothetical protein FB45DRAFT_147421 [Roridomyces roridus]
MSASLRCTSSTLLVRSSSGADFEASDGAGSRQSTITPRDGACNIVDKKFFKPFSIDRWVVICEHQTRFSENTANDMIDGLPASCRDVGSKLALCFGRTAKGTSPTSSRTPALLMYRR